MYNELLSKIRKMTWWQQLILAIAGFLVFKMLFKVLLATALFKGLLSLGSSESFNDSAPHSSVLKCTMFFAPWCGHCKTAKPEWEKLEVMYNGKQIKGTTIIIEKIDGDQNPQLAQQENIQGYPTFKFEKDGKKIDYNGGRTVDEWKKFIDNLVN